MWNLIAFLAPNTARRALAAIKVTNAVLQGVSISASVLDPGALLVVPVVIGGFALLAAFLSGRKATLMDPAVVLRTET